MKSKKNNKFDFNKFKKSYYKHQDKGLIDLGLEQIEDFYSPLSLKENKKIDKEVDDYICDSENYIPLDKEVEIDIYLEKTPKEEEKEEAILTYRKYYAEYIFELNSELKRYLWLALIFFIIGTAFVSLMFILQANASSHFLLLLAEITAWVLIWETVDITFLHGFKMFLKKRRAKRLLHAEIRFKSYKKVKTTKPEATKKTINKIKKIS